jgi:hypothetical protein
VGIGVPVRSGGDGGGSGVARLGCGAAAERGVEAVDARCGRDRGAGSGWEGGVRTDVCANLRPNYPVLRGRKCEKIPSTIKALD